MISPYSLSFFRLVFGALMAFEVFRYLPSGMVNEYYVEPAFLFSFLPFIGKLPALGMYLVFLVMGLSALGIMLGLYYRVSSLLFTLLYSYVFLLDKVQYNNHFYFIILLGILFSLTDAHAAFSFDAYRRGYDFKIKSHHLLIFKLQVLILFFFGGLAKLRYDWLFEGGPIAPWFQVLLQTQQMKILHPLFQTSWFVYFITWTGLIFDLCIGFLLWAKPTRYFAILLMLVFNLGNNFLFSIGIFPLLSFSCVLLFLDEEVIFKLIQFLGLEKLLPRQQLKETKQSLSFPVWMMVYLFLQIVVPLRRYFYPGDTSWTEYGHRFSWRMKIRDKRGRTRFHIVGKNQHRWVDPHEYLSDRSVQKMLAIPDMIHQFSHFLASEYEKKWGERPQVFVDSWISLNNKTPRRLIDPKQDLAQLPLQYYGEYSWLLLN